MNKKEVREKAQLLKDISFQLLRITIKITVTHNKPKDFGCGVMLYPSEIHTLGAIGDNPEMSPTELAKVLGITKGAISQTLKKLEEKKLIVKHFAPGSAKQHAIILTNTGEIAYDGHEVYHVNLNEAIEKKLGGFSIEEIRRYQKINSVIEELVGEID